MLWSDLDINGLVDATKADAGLRKKLASDPQLWQLLGAHAGESLLLISNLAATLEGNKLALEYKIPQNIVATGLKTQKGFWTSLSNCCQITALEDDQLTSEMALQELEVATNPILQLAFAQIRGGSKNWYDIVRKGATLYAGWYSNELPAADIFDSVVSATIDLDFLPLLPSSEPNLYKVLDSVVYARNGPVPMPLVKQLTLEFCQKASQAKALFESRDEDDWSLFILYMELLTNMAQNDPEVKHELFAQNLVQVLSDFLFACKSLPNYNKLSTAPSEIRAQDFPMLRSGAIALLSQVVVQQPAAQDQLRECGGLALVLEACVIDANNPYMKERAIICVRYALEANEASQAFVAGLEQRQGVDAEALQRAGLEVEVVDGQLKLKNQIKSTK